MGFNQTQGSKGATVGNPNTEGNKKSNYSYQSKVLQILGLINASISAIPGVDYETRTTTYRATANGPGYSTNDIIVRYDIIDVATSTVLSTVWFNQTTQATIAAPAPGNVTPYSPPGSVTVTNAFNLEATQLLIHALLTSINTSLTSVSRTPTMLRATGIGSVPAGTRSVSFYNAGVGNATVLGGLLLPGEQVSFPAGGQGDTLTIINYDATGTDLLITTVG